MHEPGPQTDHRQALRRRRRRAGPPRCSPISRAIRRPRSTSRSKFARHFIADEPPPALVERLSKRFLDTGGDLKELARTLIASDEAWDGGAHAHQASGRMDRRLAARDRRQPARRPAGDPGAEPARRAAVAAAGAQRLLPTTTPPGSTACRSGSISPIRLARRNAGDGRSDGGVRARRWRRSRPTETRRTITRAESRPQALALLLMSPEFQRR